MLSPPSYGTAPTAIPPIRPRAPSTRPPGTTSRAPTAARASTRPTGAPANGTALQQWACGTGANQSWQFRPINDGFYQVVNRYDSKVWDVDGGPGATVDGTKVHPWSYEGGTNQQWRPDSIGTDGQYRFTARDSGKCLTVDNGSTANGARLSQQPCTNSTAQTFTLAD
ncbi:hypothetical protein QF034_006101 [Streptomyces africanus]|uniref:Ricin B lectin domain-containing protein n=1 Tax=Streptomyces africanus TaxID=231024 RepID=A0ABU0QXX8_9ACTN|nr:hypothetical protein [Streptomyces africanus]